MITQIEVRSKIREYIKESTFDDVKKISDQTLIFEEGVLDSMGLLFLIEFLDETFNVKVSDEELNPKNFESVDNIVSFVDQKQ